MAGADALVVGAGAAGIAAARLLHDAGLDVLLLEAGDRIGGRAHSVDIGGFTLDFRLYLAAFGAAQSLDVAGRKVRPDSGSRPLELGTQWRNLGFSLEERAGFERAWGCWEENAHAALGGTDRPLSDFIDPTDPWRPLIDAISGYANGAPLDRVSLHDWAAYEDAATEDNWTVREGYGTLVARHGAGLPVRLGTKVTRIDHNAPEIRVETDAGTLITRAVIVTVSTAMLVRETIRFDPPLPDKQAAAADLPLGLADKIFLRVAGGDLPTNGHLIGDPYSACTASYRLAPFGLPVIEAFIGGACAEMLEDGDDRAAAAFAIEELVGLLGGDWRARLTPITRTRWRHEAHIGGSYSHARVGAPGQRAVLAEPVDDRLFFAGEACSVQDFSTAHGAYDTGLAAARGVLVVRGGQR